MASSLTDVLSRRPDAVRWLPWMIAAWVAFFIPIPRWMAGYGIDIVMFVVIVWASVLVARSRQVWGRVLGWTSIAVMAAFVTVTVVVGFIEGLQGY